VLRLFLIVIGLIVAPTSYGTERAAPSSTPELSILKIDSADSIGVTLSPASKGPTRIWQPGNSWGAANWRVFIVRGAGLFSFREDPDAFHGLNAPRFEELKGPKSLSFDLSYKLWLGPKAEFGALQAGDKVIVVYDVPVTMEARLYGVWYGTISALGIVK
jgi:hypothetical protein